MQRSILSYHKSAAKSANPFQGQGVIVDLPGRSLPKCLSAEESDERERCETIVAKGWNTLVQIGEALATIRNSRLHRGQCGAFKTYCRQQQQYGRAYAYHLIGAAEAVKHLSTIDDIPHPDNEFQVRLVIGLDPIAMKKVWTQAVRASEQNKVAASLVEEKAAAFKSPKRSHPQRKGFAATRAENANLAQIDATLDMLEEGLQNGQPLTHLLKLLENARGCFR